MNILDENIIETQCRILRSWRIRSRQIGSGIGAEGMKDREIVSLFHNQNRPTFFTRDRCRRDIGGETTSNKKNATLGMWISSTKSKK